MSAIRSVITGASAAGHECVAEPPDDAAALDPEAILHRVSTGLDREKRHRTSAGATQYDEARSILFSHGAIAVRKLGAGDGAERFSNDELASLEAIIQFDGSRPALALRRGGVDEDNPFIGRWVDDVRGDTIGIRRCAGSVGRLELSSGGPLSYFGTGFAIARGAPFILTAGHVLDGIVKRVGRDGSKVNQTFELGDDVRIDFDGEVDAEGKHLLKVEAGVPFGGRIDAALLAVRPLTADEDSMHADAEMPPVMDCRMEKPIGGKPITGSLCVIGFPFRFSPPRSQPDGREVNWEWVRFHLMGGAEGVKRLSPGLPSIQPTDGASSFEHDATTAVGNSGSPVIAWKDADQPAIGVHVSGMASESNKSEFLASIEAEFDRAAHILRGRLT
ncbi:trypsin-like serine peptidase [Bradyrhizobium liaoningense]